MIRFIYKLIHFEGSIDHRENVMKSFLFIWIFVSIIQFVFLYLLYIRFTERNTSFDYTFLLIAILTSVLLYYLIRVRQVKIFFDKGIDKEYFDFGKYNGILKPTFVFLIVGSIVFVFWFVIFLLN